MGDTAHEINISNQLFIRTNSRTSPITKVELCVRTGEDTHRVYLRFMNQDITTTACPLKLENLYFNSAIMNTVSRGDRPLILRALADAVKGVRGADVELALLMVLYGNLSL